MSADDLEADKEMARIIAAEIPEAYDIIPPDVICGFVLTSRGQKQRREVMLEQIRTNRARVCTEHQQNIPKFAVK